MTKSLFEQVVIRLREFETVLEEVQFKILTLIDPNTIENAEDRPDVTLFGQVEIDGELYYLATFVPLDVLLETPNDEIEFKRQPGTNRLLMGVS